MASEEFFQSRNPSDLKGFWNDAPDEILMGTVVIGKFAVLGRLGSGNGDPDEDCVALRAVADRFPRPTKSSPPASNHSSMLPQ